MKQNKPNTVILELAHYAAKYPLDEKILIMSDRISGRQLLENLARLGNSWVNFRVETVESLAEAIADAAIAEKGSELLPSIGTRIVIDGVFNDLAEEGKLKYFRKNPVNKGIIDALSKTILDLRFSGITAEGIKKEAFISPKKAEDIGLILRAYEKELSERNYVDMPGLIKAALENASRDNNGEITRYFIPERHYMTGIKRQFIEKLCGKYLTVLAEDEVHGLEDPSGTWHIETKPDAEECKTDIDRLKWLFSTTKAPAPFNDNTIDIFSAVGFRNEVREIFRRIESADSSIDDVEIVYTDRENYVNVITAFCEKNAIPVTFAEGIDAYTTPACRTLMSFLMWMKEDFSEEMLTGIIGAGNIQWKDSTGNTAGGGVFLAGVLRTSGIGWKRERYTQVLNKKIKECSEIKEEYLEMGEDEKAARQVKTADDLRSLKALCERLLSIVPKEGNDGRVHFEELCEGCEKFLNENIKVVNENDAAFITAANKRLALASSIIKGRIWFEEAIDKIVNLLSDIRICAGRPEPGHLYVSHYNDGCLSGRNNVFIAGLNESNYPVRFKQDPVLLDEEREKLSDELEVTPNRMRKNVFEMAALAAGLRGSLTVSYSSYDVKEGRKSFPSAVVLQVYRVLSGNPAADYDSLFKKVGDPSGFCPDSQKRIDLDETDWWLNRLSDKGMLKNGIKLLEKTAEGVKNGIKAVQARNSMDFTEYDGKVKPDGNEFDIRAGKQVVSCSRLETAAKCPFAYFMEYILKVRMPEEFRKDMSSWLDAMERGRLLHDVYQVYIDMIIENKVDVKADKQGEKLFGVLDDIVKRYRDDIPPPSEVVFQNEYEQLKRDMGVFLHINKELKTVPVGTEVCFGIKEKDHVKILLGGGKGILLRGKIDRIDKASEDNYHVWDYKTGSSSYYEGNKYIDACRQIQHALYAVAADVIIKKTGKDKKTRITRSGYLTPTEKGIRSGGGGIFPREESQPGLWQEALNKLADVLASGTFVFARKDECRFCDYADVCGGEKAVLWASMKCMNPDNKELIPWIELGEYE